MTTSSKVQDNSKAISDLLEWQICERNKDGELKPTADFLVWYYDYLIHDITEMYGGDWEDTITGEETKEELDAMDERDKEKDEFVEDAIRNQIVGWTSQKGPDGATYAKLDVDEHVKIVDSLIKEIDERLFHVQQQKTKRRRKDGTS